MDMLSPLQMIVNEMNIELQKERAKTQMTLGELIKRLENMPQDAEVDELDFPHSYRGYYEDLAFEPTGEKIKVKELLELAEGAMGKEFNGYKGGCYVMWERTPVWVAKWGDLGDKLIDIKDDGSLVLEKDE